MDPSFPTGHLYLGKALIQKGDLEGGLRECREAARLANNHPFQLAWLAYANGMAGNKSEALRLLHQIEGVAQQSYVASHDMAAVHVSIGQRAEAVALLNKAYEERFYSVLLVRIEPEFEPLRNDPGFRRLVQMVGSRPQRSLP